VPGNKAAIATEDPRNCSLGMTVKMTVKPNGFEKRARRGNDLDVPLMIEWE